MIATVEGSYLKGTIPAIPSKSYAHRVAICNFLSKAPIAVCKDFSSNDIDVTVACLENIRRGVNDLDVGESGSTLRFLLPLCAALGGKYSFIGHGKLMQRPNDELFAVMRAHGIKVEQTDKIYIDGKLTSGEYKIRGDISSQYISGLLMALPFLCGDSEIVLTTPLCSAPYVEITLEVLKAFGIAIERTGNGFKVCGNQKYNGNSAVEGDWSNAAFFLVGAAINGEVTISGLNSDSVQGDKFILEILRLAGAAVEMDEKGVTVKKSEIKSFEFSAGNCPDLVPIAAVLAAFANGKSVIKDVERLKIKESDRIESTMAMLNGFGIKSESDGKSFIVYGGNPVCGKADSFNDHRLAMASSILALGAQGVSTITGANAVNKSYPTFYDDCQKLGGIVKYV